jgi:activator of 2-hydroxyglutaryl-CoA dehydratase
MYNQSINIAIFNHQQATCPVPKIFRQIDRIQHQLSYIYSTSPGSLPVLPNPISMNKFHYDKPFSAASPCFYLGLDIGSVSLNTVITDQDFTVLENHYDFIHGKPFHTLLERLTGLLVKYPAEFIRITGITVRAKWLPN